MQVVEREQERPVRREVRGQPVEPVQTRQRRVPRRLGRDLSGIEERLRERGRTCHHLGPLVRFQSCEQRLEELAHNAVGKRPLELRTAARKNPQPRLLRTRSRLAEQRRLADPGRALDRQQPPAVADGGGQLGHRRQFALALEQVEFDGERRAR